MNEEEYEQYFLSTSSKTCTFLESPMMSFFLSLKSFQKVSTHDTLSQSLSVSLAGLNAFLPLNLQSSCSLLGIAQPCHEIKHPQEITSSSTKISGLFKATWRPSASILSLLRKTGSPG